MYFIRAVLIPIPSHRPTALDFIKANWLYGGTRLGIILALDLGRLEPDPTATALTKLGTPTLSTDTPSKIIRQPEATQNSKRDPNHATSATAAFSEFYPYTYVSEDTVTTDTERHLPNLVNPPLSSQLEPQKLEIESPLVSEQSLVKISGLSKRQHKKQQKTPSVPKATRNPEAVDPEPPTNAAGKENEYTEGQKGCGNEREYPALILIPGDDEPLSGFEAKPRPPPPPLEVAKAMKAMEMDNARAKARGAHRKNNEEKLCKCGPLWVISTNSTDTSLACYLVISLQVNFGHTFEDVDVSIFGCPAGLGVMLCWGDFDAVVAVNESIHSSLITNSIGLSSVVKRYLDLLSLVSVVTCYLITRAASEALPTVQLHSRYVSASKVPQPDLRAGNSTPLKFLAFISSRLLLFRLVAPTAGRLSNVTSSPTLPSPPFTNEKLIAVSLITRILLNP